MNLKESVLIHRLPILGGSLLWMGFHFSVLHYWYHLPQGLSLWDAFLSNIILLNACILLGTVLTNYIPKAGRVQFTVVLSLALAWLAQWIVMGALKKVGTGNADYTIFLDYSMPVRWIVDFLIIEATGIATIFYSQGKELKENLQRESDAITMAREAELQKLQLQLQPHFLFNSLNSINALILIQPDRARQMTEQLSDFLRVTLRRADEQFVPFKQEWEYLQLYLSIEKVRFGHRLEMQFHIDEACHALSIPTLVLQPLLENAIKFGLYGTLEGVVISLSAKKEGNFLDMEISNPFDADSQPPRGSGFGLSGLQRRLYLLYARNDLMLTRAESGRFIVNLKIPISK